MNRSRAELRAARAAEMAAAGATYETIAKTLGFNDRSGAWRAARRCLRGRQDLAAKLLVERALVDLAVLDAKLWPKAAKGDLRAAGLVIRGLEAQGRLHAALSTQGGQRVPEKEPGESNQGEGSQTSREINSPGYFTSFVAH